MFFASRRLARQAMLWCIVVSLLLQPPLAVLAQVESLQADPVLVDESVLVPSESVVVPEEVLVPSAEESSITDPSLENNTFSPVELESVISDPSLEIPAQAQEQTPLPLVQEMVMMPDIPQVSTTLDDVQKDEVPVDAVSTTSSMHPSAYQFLMRTANQLAKGEVVDANNSLLPTDKSGTADALRAFIVSEKERLDAFDIPSKNKRKYLHLLRQQAQRLVPEEQGWFKRLTGAVGDFFGQRR